MPSLMIRAPRPGRARVRPARHGALARPDRRTVECSVPSRRCHGGADRVGPARGRRYREAGVSTAAVVPLKTRPTSLAGSTRPEGLLDELPRRPAGGPRPGGSRPRMLRDDPAVGKATRGGESIRTRSRSGRGPRRAARRTAGTRGARRGLGRLPAGEDRREVEGGAWLHDGVERDPGSRMRVDEAAAPRTVRPPRPGPASAGRRRSASIRRTRASGSWARAPARLIAVVVFPSPTPGSSPRGPRAREPAGAARPVAERLGSAPPRTGPRTTGGSPGGGRRRAAHCRWSGAAGGVGARLVVHRPGRRR